MSNTGAPSLPFPAASSYSSRPATGSAPSVAASALILAATENNSPKLWGVFCSFLKNLVQKRPAQLSESENLVAVSLHELTAQKRAKLLQLAQAMAQIIYLQHCSMSPSSGFPPHIAVGSLPSHNFAAISSGGREQVHLQRITAPTLQSVQDVTVSPHSVSSLRSTSHSENGRRVGPASHAQRSSTLRTSNGVPFAPTLCASAGGRVSAGGGQMQVAPPSPGTASQFNLATSNLSNTSQRHRPQEHRPQAAAHAQRHRGQETSQSAQGCIQISGRDSMSSSVAHSLMSASSRLSKHSAFTGDRNPRQSTSGHHALQPMVDPSADQNVIGPAGTAVLASRGGADLVHDQGPNSELASYTQQIARQSSRTSSQTHTDIRQGRPSILRCGIGGFNAVAVSSSGTVHTYDADRSSHVGSDRSQPSGVICQGVTRSVQGARSWIDAEQLARRVGQPARLGSAWTCDAGGGSLSLYSGHEHQQPHSVVETGDGDYGGRQQEDTEENRHGSRVRLGLNGRAGLRGITGISPTGSAREQNYPLRSSDRDRHSGLVGGGGGHLANSLSSAVAQWVQTGRTSVGSQGQQLRSADSMASLESVNQQAADQLPLQGTDNADARARSTHARQLARQAQRQFNQQQQALLEDEEHALFLDEEQHKQDRIEAENEADLLAERTRQQQQHPPRQQRHLQQEPPQQAADGAPLTGNTAAPTARVLVSEGGTGQPDVWQDQEVDQGEGEIQDTLRKIARLQQLLEQQRRQEQAQQYRQQLCPQQQQLQPPTQNRRVLQASDDGTDSSRGPPPNGSGMQSGPAGIPSHQRHSTSAGEGSSRPVEAANGGGGQRSGTGASNAGAYSAVQQPSHTSRQQGRGGSGTGGGRGGPTHHTTHLDGGGSDRNRAAGCAEQDR